MNFNTFRIIGSCFLVIGYFIMLNIDIFWGVVFRLIANILSLPWAIKNKVWDFMVLLGFFMVIELHKFLQIVFK